MEFLAFASFAVLVIAWLFAPSNAAVAEVAESGQQAA